MGGTFDTIDKGGLLAGDRMKTVIASGDPLLIQQKTVQKMLEDNLKITSEIDAGNIEASVGQRARLKAENESLGVILQSLIAIARANDIIADKQGKGQQGQGTGGKGLKVPNVEYEKAIGLIQNKIALQVEEMEWIDSLTEKQSLSTKRNVALLKLEQDGIIKTGKERSEYTALLDELFGRERDIANQYKEHQAINSALANTEIGKKEALGELLV